MALLYLRHILFDMLPSPDMKAQGQLLSISNHLEMLHDSLWAINAVIIDGELQAYYMDILKENLGLLVKSERWNLEQKSKLKRILVSVEKPDLEEWVKEVDLVIVDVEELLSRILQWKPRIAETSNCSSNSFLHNANRALFRRSVLIEMKEMVQKLNYLRRRGSALGLHREMLDSMHPLQEDYSDILRDEVVGRDTDKDHLINLLQQQQQPINNGDHTTSIIVIKQVKHYRFGAERTTLARMIYHDIWVHEYFEYRIWVDAYFLVDPSSTDIAKEILRSIKRSEESLQEENANWSTVKHLLSKNRYLLILDNYMNFSNYMDRWLELKDNLLHLGRPGSAVIINMYFETKSYDLENTSKYVLRGISEDAWKELLVKQAVIHPADTEDQHHARVALTRNDEDDKFHVNPMAHARIVGAIVRLFTEMKRWNVNDTLSPVFSLKNRLLEFLELYHGYESHVHIIASIYSSLFPVYPRPSHREIRLTCEVEGLLSDTYTAYYLPIQWMVNRTFNSRIINRKPWIFCLRIGEDARIPQGCLYLCLLLHSHASGALSRRRRSSLTAGINKKLRMLVLLDEGRKEDDISLEDQIYETAKGIFKKLKCLRILYISSIRIKQVPNTLAKLRSLRYLNLYNTELATLPESLCSLYNLMILYLDRCEKLEKLPERIGKLMSLRNLVLRYCTRLEKLPKSISRLANLEELNMCGCHWLIELPEGMENMKLRQLYMEECPSLTKMPLNIRQMTHLEILSGLIAAYNDDDGLGNICLIPELHDLTNLRVLYLRNLERISKQEDIHVIKLQDKGRLEALGLHWECYSMDEDIADAASLQVIEALKPNPKHLSFLNIISYPGKDFPSWIKQGVPTTYFLNYLEGIMLINLKGCKKLPPLGHLPFLKTIKISGMDLVSVVDESFYGDNGIFPSLESIIFSEMPILEEWQAVERESHVLPRLEQLILIQCPKFKGFYTRTRIRTLSEWLNNKTLWMSKFTLWNNFSFVESLEIVGCYELKFFPLAMQRLRQLKKLTIISCNKLEALPDWLRTFEHLKELYISNCVMLSFIPKGLKQTLSIEGCPKLQP